MMAALQCAAAGQDVTLLEKNEKLGKKLYITGKGRCNLTNACDVSDLFSNVMTNPKFLYSAFYGFSNQDTISFFEGLGLATKQERGNRVFPRSDKSSDVIRVLERECRRRGVTICLNTQVKDLTAVGQKTDSYRPKRITGVLLKDGRIIESDAVILATGGISYPSTGSTGDGHRMAKDLGHALTPLRPGLTGICVKEDIPMRIQGLTLKNCSLHISSSANEKKHLYDGMGELLFTHYGVSGPLILSASSQIGDRLEKEELLLHIDIKPALSAEQLDRRILRDFDAAPNTDIKNALVHLLPKSLIPVILSVSGIHGDKKVHRISREERGRLRDQCKDLILTLTALRPMEEAIITRGGIRVKEVDPATMASKIVDGLYFAGEILDLDALTGGFNLQIAWSTGYAAGCNIK